MDDISSDVGQTEITSAVAVCELGVIEAEHVKRGGVKVVNVDGLINRFEPKVVCGSVGCAAFNAASCEQR
jgi:hypothetical protein